MHFIENLEYYEHNAKYVHASSMQALNRKMSYLIIEHDIVLNVILVLTLKGNNVISTKFSRMGDLHILWLCATSHPRGIVIRKCIEDM